MNRCTIPTKIQTKETAMNRFAIPTKLTTCVFALLCLASIAQASSPPAEAVDIFGNVGRTTREDLTCGNCPITLAKISGDN